jgi:hypothetical protein
MNAIITGIEQEEIMVSVYPNPVKDYLYIDSPYPIQHLELSDCLGRPIQTFSNVRQLTLSLINNPPGIYILRIKSGTRLKTLKIIKE